MVYGVADDGAAAAVAPSSPTNRYDCDDPFSRAQKRVFRLTSDDSSCKMLIVLVYKHFAGHSMHVPVE